MTKVKIKLLMLEMTRKCRSNCLHCMRGDSQPREMTQEVMTRMFKDEGIESYDEIILSGGEPLLALEPLKNLVEAVEKFRPKIDHFRVITSLNVEVEEAKEARELLDKLFLLTESPDLNVVFLSHTEFHPPVKDEIRKLFEERTYFNAIEANLHSNFPTGDLQVACGRAQGRERFVNPTYFDSFAVNSMGNVVFGLIYVSYDGRLFTSCNLSYELMDKKITPAGDLDKLDFSFIIKGSSKPRPDVQTIEIPTSFRLSFSNYWNGLSEEQRGQWFGYAFDKLYGVSMPGYGIFRICENFEEARQVKSLESFLALLDLRCVSAPSFASPEEIEFYQTGVLVELVGYINLNLHCLFASFPAMQLVDLYYHDVPYAADHRLKPILDRMFHKERPRNVGR